MSGKQRAGLHYFSGQLPDNQPFFYVNNINEHKSRVRTLVTYTFSFNNVEQHMIQVVIDYTLMRFKHIATLCGGILIEQDLLPEDHGPTNLF